jgi:hypothetical protein
MAIDRPGSETIGEGLDRPGFGALSGGGGGGSFDLRWQKVYEIDFDAQATYDFKASGASTMLPIIGATATWTPHNSGTATNIDVGASGLRVGMPAGGTEQWNASTQTSPGISATIASLIGIYGEEDWIAVQSYIVPANIPTTGAMNKKQCVTIHPNNIPSATTSTRGGYIHNASGSQTIIGGTLWNRGDAQAFEDVFEFQQRGIYGEASISSRGSWSGVFPTPLGTPTSRGGGPVGSVGENDQSVASDRIVLTGENSGSAPAYDMIWHRIAIWRAPIVVS